MVSLALRLLLLSVLVAAALGLTELGSSKLSSSSKSLRKMARLGRKARCNKILAKDLALYEDVIDNLSDSVVSLKAELKTRRRQNRKLNALLLRYVEGNGTALLTMRESDDPVSERQPGSDKSSMAALMPESTEDKNNTLRTQTKQQVFPDCRNMAGESGTLLGESMQVRYIQPDTGPKLLVPCVLVESTGWLVIQKRGSGSVDFNKPWDSYREGFGNYGNEFWLGNELIHKITSKGAYQLMVTVQTTESETYWAKYGKFALGDNSTGYTLHVKDYNTTSTLPDDLLRPWQPADGYSFITKDRMDWNRCENLDYLLYNGGWWYHRCPGRSLNGRPWRSTDSADLANGEPRQNGPKSGLGMTWYKMDGKRLSSSVMMIAPADV